MNKDFNKSFIFNKVVIRQSERVFVLSKAYQPEAATLGSIAYIC